MIKSSFDIPVLFYCITYLHVSLHLISQDPSSSLPLNILSYPLLLCFFFVIVVPSPLPFLPFRLLYIAHLSFHNYLPRIGLDCLCNSLHCGQIIFYKIQIRSKHHLHLKLLNGILTFWPLNNAGVRGANPHAVENLL